MATTQSNAEDSSLQMDAVRPREQLRLTTLGFQLQKQRELCQIRRGGEYSGCRQRRDPSRRPN